MTDKREKPLRLDMPFSEALARFARARPEEISLKAKEIRKLAPKMTSKEISPGGGQSTLIPVVEKDISGVGMGVLSDGTPYLNQRGLAMLCGVQNAHVGTISAQWGETEQKPRITAIKNILTKAGFVIPPAAHIQLVHNGRTHYCYPSDVCLAILEYYAFDAGSNCQVEARDNFRLLAGSKLRELIYSQLGYDPTGNNRFKKWHERIAMNHQSAPKGFFHVFNEAHTIIYELILAGAEIGEKFVVDISIGIHWAKFWADNGLATKHGERCTYPHRYPDDHPQAYSNPQESWCYPLSSLGDFRQWLQDIYIEGGKFKGYLQSKVKKGEIPPSVAQLAIKAIVPPQLEGPT